MAPERRHTREDLEKVILGETANLTAQDVAEHSGADVELTRRLWRALGFPELQGEMMFTESDAQAVSTLVSIVDGGLVDLDTALNMTRGVGQTMARLADWETASVVPNLLTMEPDQSRLDASVDLLARIGRPFEELLVYAWRRHLAAAVARAEALGANDEELNTTEVTVGFADLVAFTALSNEMAEHRIGDLVETFESRVHDVIAAHSGRAIKSLGDSVLFVNDDPVRALDTAEGIIEVIGRDDRMPDVRLGLATGSVVLRLGDVFGPPVNLAARLTTVARRNRVIIDDATARLLPTVDFETRRLPPRPLRGFGLVEPVTVRRH
ncbi:Adenylate cyclase [metagenome]|uniref:Adenylate cyclase n=1 Tax=metagenome TaxID=256318 RepID=A0A2P2C4Y5_9ZZZZ